MRCLEISKLLKMIDDSEDFVLVDVRHKKAFERSHLPGALSIPLSEIQKFFSRLLHDKPIIVYCQNSDCEMSEKALKKLSKLGFDHYTSEKYGLYNMQNLLIERFPELAIQVLEDVERVSCACCGEFLSLR